MALNLPLMQNNILKEDLDKVIHHLSQNNPKLTQGENVKMFEEEWSEWLGVKFSVFVNSGSSTNMLTLAALKHKFPDGGEVIVPPLTWVSDIASVLQFGFKPVFVDIDPYHLGMDNNGIINAINQDTKAVFLTHVQGFNGLTDKLLDELHTRDIILIEDACEALGSKFKKKPLGTFGEFSSYSFYYSHHITSGEGGMICVKDKKNYEILKSLRSHGGKRDLKRKKKISKKNKNIDKNWIFINSGFNLRPTDINAAIGLEQLKRLDKILNIRKYNFKIIKKKLIEDKRYNNQFTILEEDQFRDIAWFGIPINLKTDSKKFKDTFVKNLNLKGIITRPIISGNFANQPSIKLYKIKTKHKLVNADMVDKNSFFIGLHNNKITKEKLNKFCELFYTSLV